MIFTGFLDAPHQKKKEAEVIGHFSAQSIEDKKVETRKAADLSSFKCPSWSYGIKAYAE